MGDVRQGRWTAEIEGDFVVFLIGARLQPTHPLRSMRDLGGRAWHAPDAEVPDGAPREGSARLRDLPAQSMNVQYWRSFEHLEAFAKDKDDPHLAAWRNYWKRLGKADRTGIWHETFLVRAGEYEAIYGNMPPLRPRQGRRLGAAARGRHRTQAIEEPGHLIQPSRISPAPRRSLRRLL